LNNIIIGDIIIGDDHPTFIIAELSANHNGSLQNALDTVRAAKEVGADAIKLQTYTADTITLDCDNEYFQINKDTLWDGQTLYSLYQKAYTPWEWHKEIFALARELDIICFSSPFDTSAVDFLEQLDVPAYKIASFEISDVNLIKYVASKGKPVIISTGIAELEDIELAIETCLSVGNSDVILLKCTSAYPAPIELANLNTISDMQKKFNLLVGLSDHTEGITAPVVSTALGGKVIEKHFILDRSIGGPDASFSLDVDDFKKLVAEVRLAERSLGKISYELSDNVKANKIFARSLFIAENIKKGEELNEINLRSVRPGYGLHPKYLNELLGKSVNQDIFKGTPMSWEFVD